MGTTCGLTGTRYFRQVRYEICGKPTDNICEVWWRNCDAVVLSPFQRPVLSCNSRWYNYLKLLNILLSGILLTKGKCGAEDFFKSFFWFFLIKWSQTKMLIFGKQFTMKYENILGIFIFSISKRKGVVVN